ncbi:MAG: hypothetical protein WC867_00665 [Candidatus Pacearchaeota archaeon]|jgi:hypothetical protein
MVEIPIINVEVPKLEYLVWGDKYDKKKDKKKIYKILAYLAIIAALIIFFRFALLAYLYIANLPKINSYDANIERIALSDDGKQAYIKLTGGNSKEIESIKFIFRTNESEYIYETTDGIKEITYEDKRFLTYFANPEYEGSYDYSIKSGDIGLEDFRGIIKVEVLIRYKDEKSGEIKETKIVDSTKKSDIKVVSGGYSGGGGSSGGSGGGSGGGDNNPTCTPSCSGKNCGDNGCGGTCGICNDNNECTDESCNSGSCSFVNKSDGSICSSGTCKSGRCVSCQSDSECNDNINCTTDKCTLGRCEITTNNNLCTNGNICDRFYGCVPEIHITQEWLNSKGKSPYYLDTAGAKYILETDVVTNGTAFKIIAKGITFDLNSYTIIYDDFESGVQNSGFEESDSNDPTIPLGWNLSLAPSARRVSNLNIHLIDYYHLEFVNAKNGEEIISSWTNLPNKGKLMLYLGSDLANMKPLPNYIVNIEYENGTVLYSLNFNNSLDFYEIDAFPYSGKYRLRLKILNAEQLNWSSYPYLPPKGVIPIDELNIKPHNNFGIDLRFNNQNTKILNGKIIQGKGGGPRNPAIYCSGSAIYNNLEISTNGPDSVAIECGYSSNVTLSNSKINGGSSFKFNRHQISAALDFGSTNNIFIFNNNISTEKGYGGLQLSGGSNYYIYNNKFISRSTLVNHHAIVIYQGQYSEIYNNNIIADPGQGILISGSSNNHNVFNNNITILKSAPGPFQGFFSLDAFRTNDYGCCNSNITFHNNNILVYGKVDEFYSGMSTTVNGICNNANGENISYSNNYIKAIQLDQNVNTWGMEPGSGYQGNQVLINNNTFESNYRNIVFVGYPSISLNNRFISNTFIKNIDYPSSNYATIGSARCYVSGGLRCVDNTRFIDSKFLNGASFANLDKKWSNYSFYIDWILNLVIKDNSLNPINEANINIFDKNGKLVFNGSSDSHGNLNNILLNEYNIYGAYSNSFNNYSSPYIISISKFGYETFSFELNLNQSRFIQVNLESGSYFTL